MDDQLLDVGPPLDVTVPNVARIYDYLLGGKDHLPPDREAAEELIRLMPEVKVAARLNRAFLARAVRRLAADGITQIIDLGSGLPTQENVHQVAQAINPAAKVVYVDYDIVAVTHGRVMLKDPNAMMLHADIRRPRDILDHPVVRDTLDFTRPVGLIAVAVMHFIPAGGPGRIVEAFARRFAPGSRLVLSHGTADGATPTTVERGRRVYEGTSAQVHLRTAAQITAILERFGTLDEPGLVPVTDRHPEHPEFPDFFVEPVPWLLVGTATKPPGTT
ncbi:S-adenosyl methyltransferase [Sinosporangium album]|uniref:S-adenosyl methyltransferase n=1 Tax=Sinosporangium album TaxID=504805 RepID=A0A1G8LU81_9ACTN|nr:SAM-dependent methyltransferase [Sinosporangium album]SDI59206.1 S-adenosyl methyltransferase [Sinosporangium album]